MFYLVISSPDSLAPEEAVMLDNSILDVDVFLPPCQDDNNAPEEDVVSVDDAALTACTGNIDEICVIPAPPTTTTTAAGVVSEGNVLHSSSTFGTDGTSTASEGDIVLTVDPRVGNRALLDNDNSCLIVNTSIFIAPVEPSTTTADAEAATF